MDHYSLIRVLICFDRSTMIPKELFKKIRRIEITTKGLVEDIFGGEYHSAFKGRGIEFSEVRPYQFGDDIRFIDWNVSARTGETFVKVFEEEREQTLMLVVDISGSMARESRLGLVKKALHILLDELGEGDRGIHHDRLHGG